MSKQVSHVAVCMDAVERKGSTFDIKIPHDFLGVKGQCIETMNWLATEPGFQEDVYATERQFPFIIYIFSNPDLAFAFKMRWG